MISPQLTFSENLNWKKLLLSAEASLGKNWSYYEAPEPELFAQLLEDFENDQNLVFQEILKLLEKEVKSSSPSWAVFKEGATMLFFLRRKNFGDAVKWEHANDVLWKSLAAIGRGSWSVFSKENDPKDKSSSWKETKFAVDAILFTIRNLNGNDEDIIERFFNNKMSPYWKSFQVFWDQIWGSYQNDRERYFNSGDYRNNQKLVTYSLLAYRLQNFDTEFKIHPHKVKEAFDYLNEFRDAIPKEKSARQEIYFALYKYLRESSDVNSPDKDLAIIRDILGYDDTFNFLIYHDSLSAVDRGRLLLSFSDLKDRWKNTKEVERKILPDLIAALKHNERSVQEHAAQFLEPYEEELFKYLRYVLNKDYEEEAQGSQECVLVLKKIARVFKDQTVKKIVNNISFTRQEKGMLLLGIPRRLEPAWDAKESPNHHDMLPLILANVNHESNIIGQAASAFLKQKSDVLQDRLNELINDLNQEDKATELIASAIEFGSESALKAILYKCTIWVASETNGTLVDRATQEARYVPESVLVLINLLNNKQEFQKIEAIRDYIHVKVLEEQQNPTIKRVFEDKELANDEYDEHTISEIYAWCYSLQKRSKAYADLVNSKENSLRNTAGTLLPRATFILAKGILKMLKSEKLKEREIVVQKWITQLLGEMSDRWFFEDKLEIYNKIKIQLERFAIESLSKRLPLEENIDIRENLVKILGNIGGRVAVDALVRTVTGEERERAARQELLSEYYLKPSKLRSEEAAILLKDAVLSAKQTMRLLQLLNVAVFGLGVLLILSGVTIALVSEELEDRLTGTFTGLGGLIAIMTQFLKDPLERIQRAIADLVQVQTAFTSFIWELNLNGTYIQSQYVSEGVLTDYDLRQTTGRIDHAMERTMSLIQTYADGAPLELEKVQTGDVIEKVAEKINEEKES